MVFRYFNTLLTYLLTYYIYINKALKCISRVTETRGLRVLNYLFKFMGLKSLFTFPLIFLQTSVIFTSSHMAQVTGPKLRGVSKTTSEAMPLQSSFLQSAVYDPAQYTLTMNFKSGATEIYQDVYPGTWDAFRLHPSKGSFYALGIKGKFASVKSHKPLLVSDISKAKKQARMKLR